MTVQRLTLVCRAGLLAVAAAALWPAQAATATSPHGARAADTAAIEAAYRQERAKCLDGRSQQDRATCLQEAGAARAEALRGRLDVARLTRQSTDGRAARPYPKASRPGRPSRRLIV